MNESPKHRKAEAVNKSTGYVIYHRQGHDVPVAARQRWALELERMKRSAESRGMTTTLEFVELGNATISHLSVSEKGEVSEQVSGCAAIRAIAEMYERIITATRKGGNR
ncbi:MAG: hypothetical protein ACRDSR_12885 [Pseudonocardiaceae bacterium]